MKFKHHKALTAVAAAVLLVACGGSLDTSADLATSNTPLAAALSSTFEEKTDAEGKTIAQLKRVVALTPLQSSGKIKPYLEARKIEVVQASLDEVEKTAPGLLYIDTSQYDTDSQRLKDFLLTYRGVLILDDPTTNSKTPEVVTVSTDGRPTAMSTGVADSSDTSDELLNPKAMALLMNLGRNMVPNASIYFATRKDIWIGEALMAIEDSSKNDFDGTLKKLLTDSYDASKDLASAAAGDRFWLSGANYVEHQLSSGWWVRYSVDAEAAHNQTGGYQKMINVRVNTNGEISGRRMGFRRARPDWNAASEKLDKPWNSVQTDDYSRTSRWSQDGFRSWVRAPQGFETVVYNKVAPQNQNPHIYTSLPRSIQDDKFKIGKEREIKAVLAASFSVPLVGFGVSGGFPIFAGGYTNIWHPSVNNEYNTWVDQRGARVFKHSWGIHLNNWWNTSKGLVTKMPPNDWAPWKCDSDGHAWGGCLNEKVNALSKDGYALGAGIGLTIDRVKNTIHVVKVKQHLRLMSCGVEYVDEQTGESGYKRGWKDIGCRDHEDSTAWKTFAFLLPADAYSQGADGQRSVTAQDLIAQTTGR